jgi:hypothetical protein
VLDNWVKSATKLRDTASYRASGEGIDDVLIELQVHLATSDGHEQLRAAELLTEAAYHGFVLATTLGYMHLAQLAAQRAFDGARISERPELEPFAMFARAADSGVMAQLVRRFRRRGSGCFGAVWWGEVRSVSDGLALGSPPFELMLMCWA